MTVKMKRLKPATTSRKILRSSDMLPYIVLNSDLQNIHDLGDNELIVIIQTQNKEAYSELVARFQRRLFVYIYHLVGNKEEVEDILQNVFSKAYNGIDSFDPARKFSSWIYRIAHNESVNFLKRKNNKNTVSWEDIITNRDKLNGASDAETPEDMMEHKEIVKQIDLAMEKLPMKYQEILKMRYFEELSYDEIGAIKGQSINTVGTLINRAKKKLLEVVKDEMR